MESLPELNILKAEFVDAGVWVRPFGNIIYLMPPYVISAEDLQTLIATMLRVTEGWARRHFSAG